jgi:predicted CXXCH cytochrome family protein
MKRILFVMMALLLLSLFVYSQPGKQPNGPSTKTQQYSRSAMRLSPHDFTSDSGSVVKGPSRTICGYCHSVHNPSTAPDGPLWTRASVVDGGTYGVYANPISLDATVDDAKSSNNYSSFCMSCHDGSAAFAASAYEKTPYVPGGWPSWTDTLHVSESGNMYDGEYDMSHIHPVNFTYDDALASADGGLFTPTTDRYVYLDATTTPPTAIGRLFGGKMQCSSCHNPHFLTTSGIAIQGTTTYSKLCIACHKK